MAAPHGIDPHGKIRGTMRSPRHVPLLILSTPLVVLFGLAACDSGSKSATTATVRPDVVITAENALAAASTAYRAVSAPTRVARIATLLVELPPLGWGEPKGGEPPTTPPLNPEIQRLDGPEGGTAMRTWDDVDGDEAYSTGDAFSLSFASYGDGGCVLEGAITFTDVVVAGDMLEGFTWTLTADVAFLGITLTVGDAEIPLSGSFALTREQRAIVKLLTLELTSDLRVDTTTVAAGTTLTRNDYQPIQSALFGDGEVLDPILGGTLAFHVDEPMTGVQVLPDPSAGTLEVFGSTAALLTIRGIDFFNAEVVFDADEDDEEPEVTTPIEYTLLWAPPPEPKKGG
jgi:hypothetical protein